MKPVDLLTAMQNQWPKLTLRDLKMALWCGLSRDYFYLDTSRNVVLDIPK